MSAPKQHRRALPPTLRREVWLKYIGDRLDGICWCCERTPINAMTSVEYGHVIAYAHGGADTVENLRPICASCNKSMQTRNMHEFKRELMASFAPTIDPSDSHSLVSSAICCALEIGDAEDTIHAEDALMWAFILGIKPNAPEKIISKIRVHKFTLPYRPHFVGTFGPRSREGVRDFLRHQSDVLLRAIFARGLQNAGSISSRDELVRAVFALVALDS